ncbi:hypothetical protein Xmau_04508 [Xenorhabdus mauleonii]|uniref:Uncharacterized protein n=1 Tax=Xenorhabdus mauleonii TaxID=351675 RepID=A0A1I3Z3I2_9GAMM|nr:hypothetical protein [Xenorhabdus mauleonii]PHM33617.1 hypothetical protein Xmau_04508 [Xenorhabdus mauleonii]SFK38644.1 hypothetical protein SAMN05421680_1891 [Xenorhabdus mauleonii]
MNIKNNNAYLLSKLSQKETQSLKDAYERDILHLKSEYEKENKVLKKAYEKEIKTLKDSHEKKIKSSKGWNEEEIQYLNIAYEKEIKSMEGYNEWLSDLLHWDVKTIFASNAILISLYFLTIYLSNNSPLLMLCIFAFMYFLVSSFTSFITSLDKKISYYLYLKAKVIYFFGYFNSHHH